MIDIRRETYSIEEASRILGISRSHCYKVVASGELRSITLGQRTVVPKMAINELLAGNNKSNRLRINYRNENNPKWQQ